MEEEEYFDWETYDNLTNEISSYESEVNTTLSELSGLRDELSTLQSVKNTLESESSEFHLARVSVMNNVENDELFWKGSSYDKFASEGVRLIQLYNSYAGSISDVIEELGFRIINANTSIRILENTVDDLNDEIRHLQNLRDDL